MKNILIVFFIVSFVLMCLVFPIKTRAMLHINFLDMKGFYVVKSWFIKILCGKVEVKNGKINAITEDTVFNKSKNKDFFQKLQKEILKKMDIKKVEFFFDGGFPNDSFSSAILCGIIASIVESVFGFLSLRYDGVKMYRKVNSTFHDENLEVTADVVISFSLIRLIISTVKAKNKLRKEIKNEG